MTKIFMLSQTVFPPDIRLEKEIKSLSESNYQVKIFCNQYKKNSGIQYKYCEIDRLNAPFSNEKFNKIINFPFFLNPRFLFRAIVSGKRFRPDVIHAHNLPMVPIGYFLKKIFNVPLVYDMHENYPAALKAYQKKGIFNRIFKNYKLASHLEKLAISVSDKIIVVVEENGERVKNYSVDSDKIYVVSNTVDINTFGINPPQKEIIDRYKNKYIILYTGVVSMNRGLDTPIKAMKYIRERIPQALFIVVGNGDGRKKLVELARENSLENFVEFVDWPGHENLNSYISLADICTIPQPAVDSNNTTIPHKLFEYMVKGKPILVSDATPLKE